MLENNEKVVKPVTLTIVDNQAFFEGDIYIGFIDDSGKLIQGNESRGKNGIGPRSVVTNENSRFGGGRNLSPTQLQPILRN